MSEKHASQDCVTHSVMFPFISCCLSRTKPQQAFRSSVCSCVCASADATSPIQPRPYNTLCVFFSLQESWWFFGASCRLLSGQNRVKYLTRPRGRGETWASSSWKGRGSSWNCDFSQAALHVHLQGRPLWSHTARKAEPAGSNMTRFDEPDLSFWCGLFSCSCACSLKDPLQDDDIGTTWIRVSTLKPGRPQPLTTCTQITSSKLVVFLCVINVKYIKINMLNVYCSCLKNQPMSAVCGKSPVSVLTKQSV